MGTALKSALAALALAGLSAVAVPAAAQGAPTPVKVEAVTPDWIVGEWRAALTDALVRDEDGTAWLADDYWFVLTIKRTPDGKLEAFTSAQQIKDASEYIVFQNDIEIRSGELLIKPRGAVGKSEWKSFAPKTLRLKRAGSQLVGQMTSSVWLADAQRLVHFGR